MITKKILVITWNLDSRSGWGRYSQDLVSALRAKKNEVIVECIEHPTSLTRHFLLAIPKALQLIIKYRKKQFDFVHCMVEPYALLTLIFAFFNKIPYFITLHGSYSILTIKNKFFGFLQYLAYKNAKNLIAVSNFTANRVNTIHRFNNIEVIPNGHSFDISRERHENHGQLVILGVGALKYRKGYHLVLEALGKLKNQFPNFKYQIIGDQSDVEYLKYLKKIISELNISHNVFFYQNVTDQELKNFYKNSDMFVLTPISTETQFEGFGLVYLEANSKGLPVVAMKGSGAEEAIVDCYNGVLANTGDVDDLVLKIGEVASNKDFYRKLSINALEWANNMQWNNIVLKYLRIYLNIIMK